MENPTFSIWEQESYLAPCDIVIVGGGLVGLWSAFFLKLAQPGLRIALLERGVLPSGASTRNAGFACFGSPSEIIRDIAAMGRSAALELVEMRVRGLEITRRTFAGSRIQFESCGGYECFRDGLEYHDVMASLDDLNRDLTNITGHAPVFTPADAMAAKLGLRGFDHLLYNPLEGALHSGALLQALTEELAGVAFFTGVEVVGYEGGGPEVRVLTTEFSLRCKQLLICTNGFASQLLGDAADVVPARGQVLLTAPIPDLSLKGTFHYEQGYYYFRNLGNRILLGGARNQAIEEETTTERTTTFGIQAALENFLETHIPQASGVPITHRWAGIMGMGREKRPLIQRLGEHITCAVRLSGVGVAISPLVGRQAASLVLG